MRRAQLGVCVRQLDAAAGEERFQRSDVITRFTSDFSEDGERLAVSLADVLSRDSATRSRQRRRDRRSRTLTWAEFEVPVATRRIAASVQEHVGPFWTPEASGKPAALLGTVIPWRASAPSRVAAVEFRPSSRSASEPSAFAGMPQKASSDELV